MLPAAGTMRLGSLMEVLCLSPGGSDGKASDAQQHVGIDQTGINRHLLVILVKALSSERFVGKLRNLPARIWLYSP